MFIYPFILLFLIDFKCNCFVISLFDYLLLVYRKGTDLCISVLFPASFLTPLIVLVIFCNVFRIFWYGIMSSLNSEFHFCLPTWIICISFSCLISVFMSVCTMLNKRGEYRHPCHLPYLKENCFHFSLLNMMLALQLPYMAFIMFSHVLSVPNFLIFFQFFDIYYHTSLLNFAKLFPAYVQVISNSYFSLNNL